MAASEPIVRGLLLAFSIQLTAMTTLSVPRSIVATSDTQLDKKTTVPKQMPSSAAAEIPLATVPGVSRIACLMGRSTRYPHRKNTNDGTALHRVNEYNGARATPTATSREGVVLQIGKLPQVASGSY